MEFTSHERRQNSRIETPIKVSFFNNTGGYEEHLTRDISSGGLFIQTPKPLPIGDQREYFISAPTSNNDLAVLGKVAYLRSLTKSLNPGMGVKFMLVEPKQESDFKRFINFLHELSGTGSRAFNRIPVSFDIYVSSATDVIDMCAIDFSADGLGVISPRRLSQGELVQIDVVCPCCLAKDLTMKGQIRHVDRNPDGLFFMGIKFTEIQENTLKRLSNYVYSLGRKKVDSPLELISKIS